MSAADNNQAPDEKKSSRLFPKILLGIAIFIGLLIGLQQLGVNVMYSGDQTEIAEKPGKESTSNKESRQLKKAEKADWSLLAKYLADEGSVSRDDLKYIEQTLSLTADELTYYRQVGRQYTGDGKISQSEWLDIIRIARPDYLKVQDVFEQLTYLPAERIKPEDVKTAMEDEKSFERFVSMYAAVSGKSSAEIRSMRNQANSKYIAYWALAME